MIRSRSNLKYHLTADAIALSVEGTWPLLTFNRIWRFQRWMRRLEYALNVRTSPIWRPYRLWVKACYRQVSHALGVTIPPNVFGPGLAIAHRGTIVINGNVRVGSNCRIHVGVNIGQAAGQADAVPRIGDNVYIAPGAKIFGDIEIADNIAIGANAVVNRSFTEPGITIAGVPARKISNTGSAGLMKRATEILDQRGA